LWNVAQDSPEQSPKKLSHPGITIVDSFFNKNGNRLFGLGRENGQDDYAIWQWNLTSQIPEGTISVLQDASNGGDLSSTDKPYVSEDTSAVFLFSGSNAIVLDLNLADPAAKPHLLMGHENRVHSADWNPDVAVTEDDGGTIRLWDLTTSRPIASPIIIDGGSLSPDGRWIAAVSESDNSVKLWKLGSAEAEFQVLPASENGDSKQRSSLTFSGDSHWLEVVQGNVARLLNLASDHPEASHVPLEIGTVNINGRGIFSPDGHWLAALSENGDTVKLWNLSSPKAAFQVSPGEEKIDSKQRPSFISFSGDSNWLKVVQGNVARLWNLSPARPVPWGVGTIKSPGTFSPDGRWLAAPSEDGNAVKLWNLSSPEAAFQILPGEKSDSKQRIGFGFSPDSQWLKVVQGNEARLWNLASARPVPQEMGTVNSSAGFSPDGRWLAAFSEDGNTVRLWNLRTPKAAFQVLPGEKKSGPKQRGSLSFSDDSHWLNVVQGNVARLWNLAPARPLSLELGTIKSPAKFSPDSHWLLVDGHLWDLRDMYPTASVTVPGASFSLDGRWLRANSEHGLTVWKLGSRSENAISEPIDLPRLDLKISDVRSSQDGRWIIGNAENGLLLWKARLTEDLIPLACRTAGRNLSDEEWKLYFPGESYRKTCPQFPPGKDVQLGNIPKPAD